MLKKVIIALVLCLVVVAGVCAQDRLTLDLSKVSLTRNPDAFVKQYDWFPCVFGDAIPEGTDFTQFKRVIIRAKYFRGNGAEIRQGNGMAQCTIFYQAPPGATPDYMATRAQWDGQPRVFEPGSNVPFQTYGIGMTGPDAVSTDRGKAINLNRTPAGLMMQNGSGAVAFIEITEITFIK